MGESRGALDEKKKSCPTVIYKLRKKARGPDYNIVISFPLAKTYKNIL